MNIQTAAKVQDGHFWFGNTTVAIRLTSAAGTDGISVVEHVMPYGEAPPLHVHRNEDEVFHILEGVMRFRVGGRETTGYAGDTIIAPKGIPHAFRVDSADGARCLTITRGADFETMLRETGRPATSAALPPFVAPDAAVIDRLVAACARNGIDIVGPPLEA